ncbi:MAG TPA: GspH/FimT family pseudopilin [Gammaproteobacteria bacterium]
MNLTLASTARPALGFTLWELLCTLAIAGVVMGLAAPGLQGALRNARRSADVNAFVTAVQLARSEAAKRGRPVLLCGSADLAACGDRYQDGWMVFVDEDGARPPRRAPAEPLLYVHRPAPGVTVSSNRAIFEFRPSVRRSTNGTVTFCDARGGGDARAVVVSYTGRPRVAQPAPGEPLPCL